MKHVVRVTVVQSCEQLQHVALDLRRGKLHPGPIRQTREVVVHVLKHQVDAALVMVALMSFRGDNLLQLDDVLVIQRLQDFYLADRRDGKALPLVVHTHLLEGNDLTGRQFLCLINLAICALSYLFNVLKVINAPCAKLLPELHPAR
eukprot:CAMPEP_0118957078 /NCGR_PEP_ID=MMETSP1169-20130426/61912_1 /TAXON_ID=36882 /ORGANISM="Pyramimonas obovata, Strain CCMP722" /LENGTH=146 /DNA_ID=CAMNT_0006905133 /DNA_START=772 /DNA_END=1212 /DNA_ORIENTATION=+